MSRTAKKVLAISLIFGAIVLFALQRWRIAIALLIFSFILLPGDYSPK